MDRCREVTASGGSTVFFSSNNIQYATVRTIIINPGPIFCRLKRKMQGMQGEKG